MTLTVTLLRTQEAVTQKVCMYLPGTFLRPEAYANYLQLHTGETAHAEDMSNLQVLYPALEMCLSCSPIHARTTTITQMPTLNLVHPYSICLPHNAGTSANSPGLALLLFTSCGLKMLSCFQASLLSRKSLSSLHVAYVAIDCQCIP